MVVCALEEITQGDVMTNDWFGEQDRSFCGQDIRVETQEGAATAQKPEGEYSRQRKQEMQRPWSEMSGKKRGRGRGGQLGRFRPFWVF